MRLALVGAVSIVVTGTLPSIVAAGTPATGKVMLAAAIEARLNRAGYLTFPMPRAAGYFEGDPVQAQRAYQVYAGLHGAQPFTFSVVVYKTVAQASAMYEQAVRHTREIGGDFHAFKVIRSGRVLYMASTAPAPDPRAPPVPVSAFLSLVALAGARL